MISDDRHPSIRLTARSLCGLLLACLVVSAARAAGGENGEWTRFRGPNGSGISDATTIPAVWTERDYSWRVKLPGGGHASPVIWKDRVFVLCGDDETARRTVICLRAEDGTVVWRKDYESKPHSPGAGNSHASSTPAVGPDGVFVTWTTPDEITLLRLDLDGHEKWRRHLGPYPNKFGSGTSLVLAADVVVLTNEQTRKGFIVGVSRRTGETRWRVDRPTKNPSWATPCLYRHGGADVLVFASASHGITAVKPRTGHIAWELRDVFPSMVAASLALGEGVVIGACGRDGRGVLTAAVRPPADPAKDKADVAHTYQGRGLPYVPTPLVKDGRLFLWGDHGVVTCLRAATGELVWSDRVGGRFYGSPVWVGGRLYCLSHQGEAVVVAAADEFKLIARNPIGETSSATPAVADGVMYIRTYTHLLSVGGGGREKRADAGTSPAREGKEEAKAMHADDVRVVDTHIHLYDPTREEGVPWPREGSRIYRPMLPEHFWKVAAPAGVGRAVVVEASPWLKDNQWVLDLIKDDPRILGLVGNLDVESDDFEKHLEQLAANPRFLGIRIRAKSDAQLAPEPFVARMKKLGATGLAVDMLVYGASMKGVADLARAVPDLRIVLNHCAGRRIDGKSPGTKWGEPVADVPNVYCKVSGLYQQSGRSPAPTDGAFYTPMLEALWTIFGEDRLIYGSNWPVSETRGEYEPAMLIVAEFFRNKGKDAARKVLSTNATKCYRVRAAVDSP